MNAVNRFNKPVELWIVGGGRRDENDCDWNRYAARQGDRQCRRPFSFSIGHRQYSRVACAFRSVSDGGPCLAEYRLALGNREQRTDSTAHVRTQTDSLDGPAAVCSCPLD